MAILNAEDHRFLESVAEVSYANPFLAERIEYERRALGSEFDEAQANWGTCWETIRRPSRSTPARLRNKPTRLLQGVSSS